MSRVYEHTVVGVGAKPLYPLLTQFPAVCFTLTLLTDLAYWMTANLMWQNFSSWLLFAGLVFGGLGAVVGIVDYIFRPSIRVLRPAWPQLVGAVIAFILALINSLVHAGDGWTAVVPWGLALSAITVIVMIVADIWGRAVIATRTVRV